jgi:sulfatase maturation enzyme AslB (radical SAM superfamily)
MFNFQEFVLQKQIESIENGYFVLTMFPSLKCELNCPHCYLSKEQRSGKTFLQPKDFKEMVVKVRDYYLLKNLSSSTIVFYWYGGEPTALPLEYYKSLFMIQKQVFPGTFKIKNQFLTNLFTLDAKWLEFFSEECDNYFQTSYDFLMRGEKYLARWMKNVRKTTMLGYNVSAINVFNNTMIGKEQEIYAQLKESGIIEVGFLPFMKNYANLANEAKEYKQWYANMSDFSAFLINFTKLHIEDLKSNPNTFRIGNIAHITKNIIKDNFYNNIAGQTLFFLEDGYFALPDYENNYLNKSDIEFQDVEYLNKFETIKNHSFEEVLNSEKRISYITRQCEVNNNQKCMGCQYKNLCSMEFWKSDNLDNSDECPGNLLFIKFLLEQLSKEDFVFLQKMYLNIHLT